MVNIKINERYMLKENLIIVEVKSKHTQITSKSKKNYCEVFYPHLEEHRTFSVLEEELQEIPFNYNQIIYNAYLEYKYKYEELLKRLYAPSVREKY